jgi:hypothetical protein
VSTTQAISKEGHSRNKKKENKLLSVLEEKNSHRIQLIKMESDS